MKIVAINTVDYGSTGKIMLKVAECARQRGQETYSFSVALRHVQNYNKYHHYYSTYLEYVVHCVLGRLTGGNGLFSLSATQRLLHSINRIEPDIIHLHNLHGFSISLPLLFNWLKKKKIKVVWTLHDCWAFTGHCTHFTMAECDKWKTECSSCPVYRDYPQSVIDSSRFMWHRKKKWFTGVENLTIVTPSQWLADLVKQSYLKEYPIRVINNGIDLGIFKPTDSNFRGKYQCHNKFILLGVAFGWGKRKGLDVFIELAKRFDGRFQIVLVGTNSEIDERLPKNIISIHRTNNQQELAEIYSAADVFVNPTREDNYPTVNMEAIACGTPVITFKTGGSPESIDETCGIVVPCDDVDAMEKAVRHVCVDKPFSQEACLARARCFDMQEKFQEYVKLYEEYESCNDI